MKPQLTPSKTYDVIIAGGGPAGCVLASRLSEHPDKQVLLLESGPDAAAPGAEHPDILHPFCLPAGNNPAFRWPDVTAEMTPEPANGGPRPSLRFLQGHSVGGGSNINGMAADRGQADDYDQWLRLGAAGWGWDGVLPYFRKLEHDLDFGGIDALSMHGSSGPMPIRRLPRLRWAPFAAAVAEALEHRGFPYLADYKTESRDGFGAVPTNCLIDRRVSAPMAYLTREVRNRPNLTILAGARVERVNFHGKRVAGVVARSNGTSFSVAGKQVIVACGAIQSPTLLLRSGVGPREQLSRHAIPVVHDALGVGANLQNHPAVDLTVYLLRDALQPPDNVWFLQNWLRFSSQHAGCQPQDMQLMVFNKCAWHALGPRVGALVPTVLGSYSKGTVELVSSDPAASPRVRFNLLDDSRDFDRLVTGLRFAVTLLTDPRVQRAWDQLFMRSNRLVAALSKRSVRNRIAAAAIASLLDRAPIRRALLARGSIDPQRMLSDGYELRNFVRDHAHPQAHPCGTCRMGQRDDSMAVVDSEGRVLGVEGLRVADASIFPVIPRGHLQFVVLMTAEKIADAVKADWQHRFDPIARATACQSTA